MDTQLGRITRKRAQLTACEPLPVELTTNLREWLRVELTYTSNALEGNTLTRQETAIVVRDGLAIEGKKVTEILEAVNHDAALTMIERWASEGRTVPTEEQILSLHSQILKGIDDENAGFYRRVPVRVAGSNVVFPNYVKVPALMEEFGEWLDSSATFLAGDSASSPPEFPHLVTLAAEAHLRLVSIHPFVDGNGRTARLLMNFLLLQAGYPPAVVRPEDRREYLTSLETAQLGGADEGYYALMYEAIERSLDTYLEAALG